MNVVAFAGGTLAVKLDRGWYDTTNWAAEAGAQDLLLADLGSLDDGDLVVMLAYDEASTQLSAASRAAVSAMFGLTKLAGIGFRGSYAFVGVKVRGLPRLAPGAPLGVAQAATGASWVLGRRVHTAMPWGGHVGGSAPEPSPTRNLHPPPPPLSVRSFPCLWHHLQRCKCRLPN